MFGDSALVVQKKVKASTQPDLRDRGESLFVPNINSNVKLAKFVSIVLRDCFLKFLISHCEE